MWFSEFSNILFAVRVANSDDQIPEGSEVILVQQGMVVDVGGLK